MNTEDLVLCVDFELVTNTPFDSRGVDTFYTINHHGIYSVEHAILDDVMDGYIIRLEAEYRTT